MGEPRVRIWGQGVQISLEDYNWLHISLERPVQTQTLASNWTLLNVVSAALCAVRKTNNLAGMEHGWRSHKTFPSFSIARETISQSEKNTFYNVSLVVQHFEGERSTLWFIYSNVKSKQCYSTNTSYSIIAFKPTVDQAGHVRGQSTVTERQLPSSSNWGWSKQKNV